MFGLAVHGGEGLPVERIVVAFPSAADAEKHAADAGLCDYTVAPLDFYTDDASPSS